MSTFIKPAFTGLNAAHALYANIHRFYEFGVEDKELVTDTALTITGADVVDDPDIGLSREFVNGSTCSDSVSIPQDCTVLLITAGRGTRVTGGAAACDCNFMYLSTSGNKISFRYGYGGGGRFESRYDGATGTLRDLNSAAFANDGAFNTGHAIAFHYADTEVRKSALNGTVGATTDSTTGGGTLGSPPVSVPMFVTNGTVTIGTTANFPVAAIVVFNTLLSDAELQDVTSDPWDMLDQGAAVGDVTGVQGVDVIANGEQNIVIDVTGLPAGQVPQAVRIGSTAGVGGTTLTGFTYATTATVGTFEITADMPTGITTGTNIEVAVDYATP